MLDEFKWYRKLRKGRWVLLEIICYTTESYNIYENPTKYWYRIDKNFQLQPHHIILKEENYN